MKRAFAILLLTASVAAQTAPDKPMEQTKKNIKALNGVPSSQLIPLMTVMANSLGVTCNYCHEPAWESDAKPAKEAARRMIRMTRAINDTHYGGRVVVTCNSCHRGRVAVDDVPSLEDAGYYHVAQSSVVTPALPNAEELFTKYVAAWGSEADFAKIAKRTTRGLATGQSGRGDARSAPYEVTQTPPSTVSIDTALSYPPEANRELGWQFFNARGIRKRYSSVKTVGVEKIRGRDAWVVEAQPEEGGRPERLYFDAARGVLLRRVREAATLLGPLPEAYDFDDYRTVDGVLVPFQLSWSRGDYQIVHRAAEVKHEFVTK
ncbi:MAG TPA: photosynthetic reaction center cytochrome c subunit family protein [Thermoanaerobaculia bacterium]|jgi:hypothetical protein